MNKNLLFALVIALTISLAFSQEISVYAQNWDFPRLDELIFKAKYPYLNALEAAKACEIDTYVGATRTVEVETLANPPYDWAVTAAPSFHMCYIGINCRDVTPETSGGRLSYHGRTPGFPLYPLNLTAFRYALELIVGCNKTVWLNDAYGYLVSRLDTTVPPANIKWYNPSIPPYPLDWNKAYDELIAAGFNGTIGGNDWVMPNGQPLRKPIYVLSPGPLEEYVVTNHVKAWNLFFCGHEVAYPPHDCNFVLDIQPFYDILDIVFYNRDHDMYFLCWGLGRNPDYLWDFFHPDADIPDGNNSPGLDYRPLNAMLDALKWSRYTERTELRIRGPGPATIFASEKHFTQHAFMFGSEEVWIGVSSGAGTHPYHLQRLQRGIDYEYVLSEGAPVGIHFLQDIPLGTDMYLHMVYNLTNPPSINSESELINICYEIQEMLYHMCPYLPIYTKNNFDLYKPGLECWCPSLGYGSASYQLKWTYGSIHWTGTPVGGTINWHLPGPISTLHPWLAQSTYEQTVLNRLYDGMLEVDSYTHADIPMMGLKYKIEDWTGPSGEAGMKITWWIRDDLYWQDGDHITADDFIWDYEFINSIQPSQLYSIWAYYHGCEKHNDYCFSIKVNVTGVWAFYSYAGGLRYPRKVWQPYYGDKTAAEAFKPWLTPHPNGTLPTSLYGTGEWIFGSYNSTSGVVKLYKNASWWAKQATGDCRQVPGIYALTTSSKDNVPKVTKTKVGLFVFNLDTKAECECAWTFLVDDTVVKSGTSELSPLAFSAWSEAINWQRLEGLHVLRLNVSNAYSSTVYEVSMYVLVGDVDDNHIITMLDLYKCATSFGKTGPPCWLPVDVDNDGIVSMSDLYICAVNYGLLC